jgi:hypothetical protein
LLHDEPHTLGYPGRGKSFGRAGEKEGHRQEFHQGGKDGRVLADDRFLEQILGKRIQPTPKVSLDEIMT